MLLVGIEASLRMGEERRGKGVGVGVGVKVELWGPCTTIRLFLELEHL